MALDVGLEALKMLKEDQPERADELAKALLDAAQEADDAETLEELETMGWDKEAKNDKEEKPEDEPDDEKADED